MITVNQIWAIIVLGYCFVLKDIIMWIISEIQSIFRKPQIAGLGNLEEKKI